MRVGFDVSALRHGRTNGTAVYAYRLAESLLQLDGRLELRLFFGARSSEAAEVALSELQEMGAILYRGSAPWTWSPDGAWWLPITARMKDFLAGLDVFHAGEFFLPKGPNVPVVATIHDLTTLIFPQHHGFLNRRLHAHRCKWVERHADRVIAVSEHTRRDVHRLLRFPHDRVHVVHEAAGEMSMGHSGVAEEALTQLRIEKPFVLAVGTGPRKNLERLATAFGSSHNAADWTLVIVGDPSGLDLPDMVKAHPRIRVVGAVSAQTLNALYRAATLFAYPSTYEGFGLPVLEAMAAGTPVMASNTSSIPEVAGDAALLIDPEHIDSIRSGLDRLMSRPELRRELVRRGTKRATSFTWMRTAEGTRGVYELAIADRNATDVRAGRS